MDLTDTIIPKSDQLNAEDLMAGPRTVTITGVEAGSSEQPVFIHLAEFPGRTFRPSKTVRRVLVAAWGVQSSVYVGRRMTLYRDPEVKFGGETVGGIRISHLSNIDKPLKVALTVTRGRRAPVVVQPLPDAPPARDWSAEVESAATVEALRALWKSAPPALHARITERVAELQAPPPDVDPEAGECDGPMIPGGAE